MSDVIDLPPEAKTADRAEAQKYQAAGRASSADGPRRTLTVFGSSGWVSTFWYADLRRLIYHFDSDWDRNGPVLILRFTAPDWTDVVIQGDDLFPLYNDVLEQRIAWLHALPAGIEPGGDGATVIRKISIHR